MVDMEENIELEEGEACFAKDDDDTNIDPDIALSYIDEKIHNVLGHFQKDFEGGVSAESLGAKFGAYGSFLPTYERSASIWSCPKTPQRNCNAPRSPNNLSTEGASQNLKAPSNMTPSLRLGTASCSAYPLHNSRAPSVDVSINQSQVAEKSPLKGKTSNRPGNPTDQRTLKVRLKVGADNSGQKNAAIYSGLGLDYSPSSSLGNSLEESEGISPISQETIDKSPTSIIQEMTSFPILGDVMVSPLPNSLLCLTRKENNRSVNKTLALLNGCQDSALLVNESASIMANGKVLKKKETKSARRSKSQVEVKQDNGTDFEDGMALELKKISANETKIAKDGGKGKLLSSELVKEESSESISGQDHVKTEVGNPRSSLVENFRGNRGVNFHKDVLLDHKDEGSHQKISASLKGYSGESKCEEGLNPQKEKVGWKATFCEDDEAKVPFKTEMLSFEDKNKSRVMLSNGKSAAVSTKESSRFGESAEPNDKNSTIDGVTDSNSKIQRIKPRKDDKSRDNHRYSLSLTSLEEKDNWMDLIGRPRGDRPKDANVGAVEMQRNAFLEKRKGRLSGKKVDKQSICGTTIQDALAACPITANGHTSKTAPSMAAPVVIEEDWVQCDSCQKWRLLPFGTKPEQLPDKWLCSMLNWLSGMNHCDISEEETTKALNALYQLPVSETQNILQNHVTGSALGVSLGDEQHLDQNHQNFSSHAISDRGKKRHGVKEKANAGTIGGLAQISTSAKNKLQESVQSRSLNGTNQHHAETNLMKKSSSQHLSPSRNIPNQREKPTAGGDAKRIKMKTKREADENGCGTSKKSRIDDMHHADKNPTSKVDLGRVRISSSTVLPTKGSAKDFRKHDDYCLSEDRKCDVKDKVLVADKKLGDQPPGLSGGGSLDVKMSSSSAISLKKRKSKDQRDKKNEIETFPNSAPDGRVPEKEESSESGFRKEKKLKVSKTEVKDSGSNDADDKSNKKGRMSESFLSGTRNHPVDRMEVGRNDKDQLLRKQKKKIASEQTMDIVDSLRRDLGSGRVSVAATSSSSKISGSRRTRANIEEVKGSPVESVSSSPLRTFNIDKFTSAGGDIMGRDDAMNGGHPVMDDCRRCSDGDSNAEINMPGTVIHPDSHNFSAPEYRDGDAGLKLSGKAKSSSEVGTSHLLNGDVDIVEQNVRFLNDLHTRDHNYDEDRVKNHHRDNAVLQKSGKGTSSRSRGKSRSATSEFDRNKIKVSDPVHESMKKSHRIESEVDSNDRVPVHETAADLTLSFTKTSGIKFGRDENIHVRRRDPVGQWSSDSRMDTKLKGKEHDGSDLKLSVPCKRNGKLGPQESPIEGENKGDPIQIERRDGKSKLLSLSCGERKQETVSLGRGPVPGSHKGGIADGYAVDAALDVSKALKNSGNVNNSNGVKHSSGPLQPDRQGVKDLNASTPMISSSQTATNILKEAKELRDTADRLKSSCFGFESNEAYFQAALKFLHGASLLETCNNEGGRNGEMSSIQAYGTAAKLCELCALEYESRQEMAAAALAYKCLEVAYMRVVYCKNSSANRERHELQATLQVVPQGESPSSSASDVDNLNNPATVDKGNLSKGTGLHVVGNQIIVARNRPNFVRLLDFTQDVDFAMAASRKSQTAFVTANVILADEQNRDCVTSVKKVVDFSFQDVEELVRLVRIAMEGISRSGFGGARD
ncbi:hypothetical protein CJ030_MR5G017290 [Morella rubra]|uniref:CW-type domain-containing protein n=1 Tax=Morella rubra TaxID=262757 RepID=A0A6A1VQ30_9ROSI|nr:hypothetical protein CJ030_MR5G017290 [Morella rubra]